MARGRKPSVVVNGKLMTGQAYRQAIIETIEEMGNNFLPAAAIIEIAASRGKCERLKAPRQAHSHPIWKHLSIMTNNTDPSPLMWRYNNYGLLEYKLKNPRRMFMNGEVYC